MSYGNAREIMEALLKLQEAQIRADLEPGKDNTTTRKFRKLIPEPIQGHFDRIRVRGKKGVSIIRNGTCNGCYMKLALGTLVTLRKGEDIQLCDNCGRYLYLPEDEIVGTAALAAKAKADQKEQKKEQKAAARKSGKKASGAA